jgi:insertion element IS1 protein InsB
VQVQAQLEPGRITHTPTDDWGASPRPLDAERHTPGKRHTQQLERKPLTFRPRIKRLARKTMCCSKSSAMHDIVIGLFVHRYECGLPV